MSEQASGIKGVLLANGIVDLACSAILLILPLLRIPVLGFGIFDVQGALMAGGWGLAAMTFGFGRILASSRPTSHALMRTLGILEGVALTVYCPAYAILAPAPFVQVLLPFLVGFVFAALYLVHPVRRPRDE